MTDISAVAYRLLGPRAVATGDPVEDSLENIIPDPLPDGAFCFVRSTGALYVFREASIAPPDGVTVVIPAKFATSLAPGRWILFQSEAAAGLIAGDSTSLVGIGPIALPADVFTSVLTLPVTVELGDQLYIWSNARVTPLVGPPLAGRAAIALDTLVAPGDSQKFPFPDAGTTDGNSSICARILITPLFGAGPHIIEVAVRPDGGTASAEEAQLMFQQFR